MLEHDIHSRSRLAGYDPEKLFTARALIVGAGALGQNLALNLALAGIGEISIVDFDLFEPHNVTRSPLYPNKEEERQRWGLEKARVVAHKLLPMMTAPQPRVRYAVAPIQSLGDLPIAHAHIVYAAVDNTEARAYLAEHCRIAYRPLIEAGFHAEIFTLTTFGPDSDDPCYRCLHPERIGAYSCTRYALQVEQAQAIPAIQNTAAVVAGLQAESGIQWLHGERSLRSKRVYGNIRNMSMQVHDLLLSPSCPGIHHEQANDKLIRLDITSNALLKDLLRAIEKIVGPAEIHFPESLVIRNYCIRCNQLANVYAPEWRWLTAPYCSECGGSFSLATKDRYISSRTSIHTNDTDEIVNLTCTEVGLPPGMIIGFWPDQPDPQYADQGWYLAQISGTIDHLLTEVHPTSS